MSILRDWRIWLAVALVAFWVWRVIVTPVEIGLVLFATSVGLLVAGFLVVSAVLRAGRDEQEAAS